MKRIDSELLGNALLQLAIRAVKYDAICRLKDDAFARWHTTYKNFARSNGRAIFADGYIAADHIVVVGAIHIGGESPALPMIVVITPNVLLVEFQSNKRLSEVPPMIVARFSGRRICNSRVEYKYASELKDVITDVIIQENAVTNRKDDSQWRFDKYFARVYSISRYGKRTKETG